MKTLKSLFLIIIFILSINTSLFAWTSSNEGVCYTMDTLCMLTDSISFNETDNLFEVDCDIIILENDSLKIFPGETIKFLSYIGLPSNIKHTVIIYGILSAIGTDSKNIFLGDPICTFSAGHKWNGLKFYNTNDVGDCILQYCNIIGASDDKLGQESAIYCENSSIIVDHCSISYLSSGEMFGGCYAVGLVGQSYPIISYTTFKKIINGVAVWCNPYNMQDTTNYPSPIMIGCNILKSVQGMYFGICYFDKVILFGGFLDNCYLGAILGSADTTLGYPVDTLGDGKCTTTSTYELQQKFFMVDGVVNPRSDTLITGINETETEILPTTTDYLVLNNNYPNPFCDYTTIEFIIKEKAMVNLILVDSKGNTVKTLIKNQSFASGEHQINWYADNDAGQKVQDGIYFYKLSSGNKLLVKKAILIR